MKEKRRLAVALIVICTLVAASAASLAQQDWRISHICRTCAWCFACHNNPNAEAAPVMYAIDTASAEQEGLMNDPGICIIDLHPQVTQITVQCIDAVPGFAGAILWQGLPAPNQLPGFYIDTFGSNAIRVTATTEAPPGREQVTGVVGHYCTPEWLPRRTPPEGHRPGPTTEWLDWDFSLWGENFCLVRAGAAGIGPQIRQRLIALGLLPPGGIAPVSFRATFTQILGATPPVSQIGRVVLSRTGRTVVFSGVDGSGQDGIFTASRDGSNLNSVVLPVPPARGINQIVTNRDGTRTFFLDGAHQRIYRVEGVTAVEILDVNDFEEINAVLQIATTSDGEYVYFIEDRDDLWQLWHGGGTPAKVIEDTLVPRSDSGGNLGWAVREFALSADGGVIAFQLGGYHDPTDYYGITGKEEIFVWDHGMIRQLTNSPDPALRTNITISGDGSVIVFSTNVPEHQWYSIRSDGSYLTPLDQAGSFGGVALDYFGRQMLYSEAHAGVARLTSTDGSGGLDLFPLRGLQWPSELCISDSGDTISFVQAGVLHVGSLNPSYFVNDGPIIQSISFDPPSMLRDGGDGHILMTVQVSDRDGLDDIVSIKTYGLLDGHLEGNIVNLPVRFDWDAIDDGTGADAVAGDGIYTHAGRPGYTINEYDQMTVRIVVTDKGGAVAVADAVLPIE